MELHERLLYRLLLRRRKAVTVTVFGILKVQCTFLECVTFFPFPNCNLFNTPLPAPTNAVPLVLLTVHPLSYQPHSSHLIPWPLVSASTLHSCVVSQLSQSSKRSPEETNVQAFLVRFYGPSRFFHTFGVKPF